MIQMLKICLYFVWMLPTAVALLLGFVCTGTGLYNDWGNGRDFIKVGIPFLLAGSASIVMLFVASGHNWIWQPS